MVTTSTVRRPSTGVRRVGYAIAVAINVVFGYLVNARPGWSALPFLADDFRQVLVLVNLSLAAGVFANLVYLADDRPRVKAFGDLITTSIGLAVLIRLWEVFPFDFNGAAFDWALVMRTLLVLAGLGTAIALLIHLAALIRGPVDHR
jgi:hypothetical protein